MKLSLKWLQAKNACPGGQKWFINQPKTDSIQVINSLISEKRFNWASWVICKLLTNKQNVRYALFVAEQVIGLYESRYPIYKRPREALEATKNWLRRPSNKNIDTIKNAVATTVNDAINATIDGVGSAAYYAADAMYATVNAAYYAADAADAAGNAANYVAAYAAYAAIAAGNAAYYAAIENGVYTENAEYIANIKERLQLDILDFGLKLLGVRKIKRARKVS